MPVRALLALALLAPLVALPIAGAIDPCDASAKRALIGGQASLGTECYDGIPAAKVWVWNDDISVMWWGMESDVWVTFAIAGGIGYDIWIPLVLDDCGGTLEERAQDPAGGSPLLEMFL